MSDQVPPQSRDAERAVIGSMIRDRTVILDLRCNLSVENFYFDAHQKICRTIFAMQDAGQAVDLVTLADELDRKKLLTDVGGPAYLAELWDAAPTSANFEHYARIVNERAAFRQLALIGTQINRDALDKSQPPTELLVAAEQQLHEIQDRMAAKGDTASIQQMADAAIARLEKRRSGNIVGIPTGYPDLDEITGGLQSSELVIIGARPSQGKTALAVNIARHVGAAGHSVLFVSLEQSRDELIDRLICCFSGVDSYRMRLAWNLTNDDQSRIQEAIAVMSPWRMEISDVGQQTAARIAATARQMHRKRGLDLVILDYAQLVVPENLRATRYEQVGQISRQLKFLARELHIPVVALAQVGRKAEEREHEEPKLSHLRESGDLEQNADAVILLHRPPKSASNDSPYHEDSDAESGPRLMKVIVAKNRNGRTGSTVLAFRKECMRFESVARGSERVRW